MPTRCCCPPESSRGKVILAALQPDQLDHLQRALAPRVAVLPAHLERKGDVFQHGAMRQQAEALEYHAHLGAAQRDQLASRSAS